MGGFLTLLPQQKQILSPVLRQSMELLAMPLMELVEKVQEELEENPLLEIEYEPSLRIEEPKEAKDENSDFSGNFDDASDSPPPPSYASSYSEISNTDKTKVIEQTAVKSETLLDHLSFQLRMAVEDENDFKLGMLIISSLDEDGYLKIPLEELVRGTEFSVEDAERVLKIIQNFDPPGVGARDLKECLLLQLRNLEELGEDVGLEKKILSEHFELFEAGKFKELARVLNVSEEEVLKAVSKIRELDPKPGRNYSSYKTVYVMPEVVVKVIDGKPVPFYTEGVIPKVVLNDYYRGLMKRKDLSPDAKNFIREKLKRARELLGGLSLRKRIIEQVTEAILKKQEDFFVKGPENLKPMTLKDIAEEIGVHESTVSRAIRDKYLETDWGIIPFKSLFSSSLSTSSDDEISSSVVKKMIKEIIDRENPKRPLSDDQISKILANRGIKISRRTVTKYRQALGIPSARKRVKWRK